MPCEAGRKLGGARLPSPGDPAMWPNSPVGSATRNFYWCQARGQRTARGEEGLAKLWMDPFRVALFNKLSSG
jgi:hypothetical protein